MCLVYAALQPVPDDSSDQDRYPDVKFKQSPRIQRLLNKIVLTTSAQFWGLNAK